MSDQRTAFFKRARVKRNLRRKHHRCKQHPRRERIVCPLCTKVYCPNCGHECTSSLSAVDAGDDSVNSSANKRGRPKKFVLRSGKYIPPPHLRLHWTLLAGLGALRFEESIDEPGANAWTVFFKSEAFRTSEEMTNAVWKSDFEKIATKTSWQIGKNLAQEWRFTFKPKEK